MARCHLTSFTWQDPLLIWPGAPHGDPDCDDDDPDGDIGSDDDDYDDLQKVNKRVLWVMGSAKSLMMMTMTVLMMAAMKINIFP